MIGMISKQREYAFSQEGQSIKNRKKWLTTLKDAIINGKDKLVRALKDDLKKPELEIYGSELSIVLREIQYSLKKLKAWTKVRRVGWGKKILPSPYGSALIIGPWNYPFQLLFTPLVSAMAAGNGITIKPSELAPATEKVIESLVKDYFPPEVLSAATGGPDTAAQLVDSGFDKIFFTGSPAVGAKVAASAAKHFSDLTLELGGKSPAIIMPKADLEFSLRRITWGKVLNSGQTCIAPDYLLVPKGKGSAAQALFSEAIQDFFGKDPQKSEDLGRIINHRHFDRLMGLVQGREQDIPHSKSELYIRPTALITDRSDLLMEEEIFGPFLPIVEYQDIADLKEIILRNRNPLALYIFGKNKSFQQELLNTLSFGGAAINEVILHIQGHELPFGGVGKSGHGSFGWKSFNSDPKPVIFKAKVRFGLSIR
jgi:aldehyde dehydrogenase (NAD+)